MSLGAAAALALAACTVSAQTPKSKLVVTLTPVRSEFKVAARSLVTAKLDRSRVIETVGAVSPLAAAATDLGPIEATAPIRNMQLVLNRPAERQAAFDAQLEALHKPGSPSFHKWLLPSQVGEEFGPSDADLATLTTFLQSEGFTVTKIGSGHTYVDFQGTAAQVEKTFNTKIHSFQLADGSVKFSATKEASIPEALAPLVVGFAGLSSISGAKPMIVKKTTPAPELGTESGAYVLLAPAKGKTPQDTVSSTNYAVGPQDFYTIYNMNPLLSASTPIVGTGVTIALLEEVRINPADVTTFRTNFGVVPNTPVSLVLNNGYTGGATTANTCTDPGANTTTAQISEEGEAVLDTEWSGAAAPGANLLYVSCAAGALPLGTVIAAEVVIDNNLADIMSMSYGLFENYNTAEDTLVNQLWEQAASQGQAVVISSGDSGSATEDGNYGDTVAKYGITVNSIASTAWNVSAGGTDFMDEVDTLESDTAYGLPVYWNTTTSTSANGFSSAKSYIPEMTWNDNCGSSVYSRYYYGTTQANPATFCGANKASKNIVAGGGGPSKLHARPTWQTGTVYGLPSTTLQPNRLQPDISLFASNGFWYHTLPMYQSDASGYGYEGGTSFVAPQLAGVFALVQQQTGERLGQPNYVLYAMAGKAFGTTTATNACSSSGSTYDQPAASTPAASCIFYDVQVGTISPICTSGTTNCTVVSGKAYGILTDPTITGGTYATPAYKAGVGYDMGTGIGTMNIANLVTNWQNTTNSMLYAPTISLTSASSSVAYGSAASMTATVSGPGSFPTGSVSYSVSGNTLGSAPLTQSAGCSTNGTCTESSTYSLSTSTLPAGNYTVTATYTPTNENYTTGATATTPLTVTAAAAVDSGTDFTVVPGGTTTLDFINGYGGTTAPTGAVSIMVNGSAAGVGTITCVNKSKHTNCSTTYTADPNMALGNYPITFTQAADANYMAISGSATLTVAATSNE